MNQHTVLPWPDRFWEKVDRAGPAPRPDIGPCWIWLGRKTRGGYGSTYIGPERTSARAHRVAWELTNGSIPAGLVVRHTCDNPPCVRPDHVFHGEANQAAKLTVADVLAIRVAHGNGHSARSLSDRFGVTRRTINLIVQRKLWRHVA